MIITSLTRAASRASNTSDSVPAEFDAINHPIISRHWFGIEPLRPTGRIATEVVVDLQHRRHVQQVHRLGAGHAGIAIDGDWA